jgi:outer membrane protein insertion porin family
MKVADGLPGVAALILFACLLMSSATAAAPIIEVTGNRHIDAETIRSHIHLGANGPSDADIDAGLKALYATQWFSDVHIRHVGDHLEIAVVENPTIGRIAFEGNKALKDKQLQDIVQSKQRGPLSHALIHDDVEHIVELYRRSGRFNVRVEPQTIEGNDDAQTLVFKIDEGARTGIAQIAFTGNQAFDVRTLRGVIKTGQTNILSRLLDNDFYDPDKVEGDRDLLRRYYRNHGFPDMEVLDASPQLNADGKGLTLTFRLNEGQRTRIATVDVTSEVQEIDPNSL